MSAYGGYGKFSGARVAFQGPVIIRKKYCIRFFVPASRRNGQAAEIPPSSFEVIISLSFLGSFFYICESLPRFMKSKVCILFLLFLASCVSHRTKETLDQADAILSEAPDSALAIVKSIPSEALSTPSIRARHALLLTQAQDKCYIDIAEDSTIRVAYDWYKRYGSKYNRLKSAYYLGVIRQNAGNYIDAVINFIEAEPLAKELKQYRWQSLCEQHLRAVYARNFDSVMALTYAEESLKSAQMSGDTLMTGYCRLDIANEFIAQSRLDTAEVLLKGLIRDTRDRHLLSYAYCSLAKVYLIRHNPEYEKAGNLYDVILQNNAIDLSCQDYVHLGLIAQYRGEISLSESYCRRAEEMMRTPVDSATFYTILSNIYSLKGENAQSNEVFSKAMEIQDRIVYAQLEQSITHALENYYQNQTDLEKEKGRS